MRPQFIQQFPLLHTERTVNPSSFSLWRVVGHRLMSRLPSQLLVPAASLIPKFSKKGCFRESASASLLEGSYSNMLSMRSNSWWCSSASDSRYRWKKGKKKRKRKKVEISGNKKKKKTQLQHEIQETSVASYRELFIPTNHQIHALLTHSTYP